MGEYGRGYVPAADSGPKKIDFLHDVPGHEKVSGQEAPDQLDQPEKAAVPAVVQAGVDFAYASRAGFSDVEVAAAEKPMTEEEKLEQQRKTAETAAAVQADLEKRQAVFRGKYELGTITKNTQENPQRINWNVHIVRLEQKLNFNPQINKNMSAEQIDAAASGLVQEMKTGRLVGIDIASVLLKGLEQANKSARLNTKQALNIQAIFKKALELRTY